MYLDPPHWYKYTVQNTYKTSRVRIFFESARGSVSVVAWQFHGLKTNVIMRRGLFWFWFCGYTLSQNLRSSVHCLISGEVYKVFTDRFRKREYFLIFIWIPVILYSLLQFWCSCGNKLIWKLPIRRVYNFSICITSQTP